MLVSKKKPTPKFIRYLGVMLPSAAMGLLVIYSFKDVTILSGTHGIPELIATLAVIGLHLWKRQMLLSIAGRHGAVYAAAPICVLVFSLFHPASNHTEAFFDFTFFPHTFFRPRG